MRIEDAAMPDRLSFFGLISPRSPMNGLLEHYEQIAAGMSLIKKSMECFIAGEDRDHRDFLLLQEQLDAAEDHADTIKRNLRNHLPRGFWLPVDKHIFFLYTRAQDDILDYGQNSLQWLALRDFLLPGEFQPVFLAFLGEAVRTVDLLRPALEGTIAWVNSESVTREEAKQHYQSIRQQHKAVSRMRQTLVHQVYCSALEFKDIYQILHVADQLYNMSHSAEGCADLLRVMIAK
jgi:predicted phosphate transport protein (TIGR00153 family)